MKAVILPLAFIAFAFTAAGVRAEPVAIPAGISHDAWDALLKAYVDDQGRVDYARWKASAADLKRLDDYLALFAAGPEDSASGDEAAAALANLYNALTVRWILENYPTDSIQALPDSFGSQRHAVGGRQVSLDEIEHETLRPLVGYQAHGVLVCAARSCPPLQRSAYRPEIFDAQVEAAYRAWLSRPDLNRFLPQEDKVEISKIFDWFKEDFEKAGGVPQILARYAPAEHRGFLDGGDYAIVYLPYNWGLNDQGGQGKEYGSSQLIWDRIVDALIFWD